MPSTSSITIQLVDLDNIIQCLTGKEFSGGVIKIIDEGKKLILRDTNDMHISTLVKTFPESDPLR